MQALETLFSHQSVRHYLKQEVEKEKVEINVRAIPLSLDDGSSGLNVIM